MTVISVKPPLVFGLKFCGTSIGKYSVSQHDSRRYWLLGSIKNYIFLELFPYLLIDVCLTSLSTCFCQTMDEKLLQLWVTGRLACKLRNRTKWMTWACSRCILTYFQFRTLKTTINYLVYNCMTRPENASNVSNVINASFEAFCSEHSSKSKATSSTSCYLLLQQIIIQNHSQLSEQL